MRRFILLCLLMFTVSSVVFAQRMTDEQVIQYVQEAQQAGKTQQQMSIELMKKGVTKEQIQRIQSKYSGKTDVSAGVEKSDSRLRTPQKYENKNKNISQDDSELSNANSKKQTIKGLRAKTDKNKQRDGGEMESELELDGEEQTDYLGYDNEGDFIADINGLITNCMHPDDRKSIKIEIDKQLKELSLIHI